MPRDTSVGSGLSYFSQPQCDFSLVLVKTDIIAIQMFVGEHNTEMSWEMGRLETLIHATNVHICSVILYKIIDVYLSEMHYSPNLFMFILCVHTGQHVVL